MLESANAEQRVPVADILDSGIDGAGAASGSAEPKRTARVSYCLLNIN